MRVHRSAVQAVAGAALAVLTASSASAPGLGTYIVTYDGPPGPLELEMLGAVAVASRGFAHLPAAVAVLPPVDLELIAGLPGVRGVYPNGPLVTTLRQSTRTVRADRVWNDLAVTGAGIGIAIVDTGIDGTHPDLCAAAEFCRDTPVKTVQNVKVLGRQDVGQDPVILLENQINTDTSSGHGTHVAGIAAGYGTASVTEAGKYRGVAPGARLIGLGTGELVEAVNVLGAFDWILEHKDDPAYNIKVVNNSWGPGKGHPFDPEEPVQRAIAAMHDAGLTVIFGAGNDGPATDTMNAFSINPKAISAAAGAKSGHIAFFSSRGIPGSVLWHPTVTTPGYNIAAPRASTGFVSDVADATAPNPDPVIPPDTAYYATGSGTSMAAPHVAGIVALMQQAAYAARSAYLTPSQVKNILRNTAVSLDPGRGPGGLPNYQGYTMGAGYADALVAVQAAAAGTQTHTYDDGVSYDVRGFTASLGPTTPSVSVTIEVAAGALSLDVMADWTVSANDVDIELYRPDGSLHSTTFLRCAPGNEPNGFSSFCTQLPTERSTAVFPAAGTWRARVKGAFAAVENVRGVWSVAYADGTAAPPPPLPASIALAATPPAGVTGQDVNLVATVRDGSGHPLPNAGVIWSTSGVGRITLKENGTHPDGTARARVRSNMPGTQTVTATAGAHSAQVTIPWVGIELPEEPGPGNSPGCAQGAGQFTDAEWRRFALAAEYETGASAPTGGLWFRDADGNLARARDAGRFVITQGNRATVTGPATFNGAGGYRYQVEVTDNGPSGRQDTFQLTLTSEANPLFLYETGGTLQRGDVRVKSSTCRHSDGDDEDDDDDDDDGDDD